MTRFCKISKAFFKSGVSRVLAFCKKYKNAIIRLIGKFIIYICKTIIESFIGRLN